MGTATGEQMTGDDVLFGADGAVNPRARWTDPETSHLAANAVKDRLGDSQAQVLALFTRPMTDEEMIFAARQVKVTQSDSGLRTRRKELVVKGKLADSGQRRLTGSGRSSIVWGRA